MDSIEWTTERSGGIEGTAALPKTNATRKHTLTSSPNNHPPSSDSSRSAESFSLTMDLPLVTLLLSPRSLITTE